MEKFKFFLLIFSLFVFLALISTGFSQEQPTPCRSLGGTCVPKEKCNNIAKALTDCPSWTVCCLSPIKDKIISLGKVNCTDTTINFTIRNIGSAAISVSEIKYTVASIRLTIPPPPGKPLTGACDKDEIKPGEETNCAVKAYPGRNILYLYTPDGSRISASVVCQTTEKELCPYECCQNDADYRDKPCPPIYCVTPPCPYFKCEDHKCVKVEPNKHDVGVRDLSAPKTVKVGEEFNATATIVNYGEFVENVTVFFQLCPPSVIREQIPPAEEKVCTSAPPRFINLNPGESRKVSEKLKINRGGIHTLLVEARIPEDINPRNDARSTYIQAIPTNKRTINFYPGWNSFSLPLIPYDIQSNCNFEKIWHYDPENGYMEINNLTAEGMLGWGYVTRVKSACYLTVTGDPIELEDFLGLKLKRGWNLIGAPSRPVDILEVNGDCEIVSGPFKINPKIPKFEKSSVLQPGVGYFVKVAGDCKLGEPDIPPWPS